MDLTKKELKQLRKVNDTFWKLGTKYCYDRLCANCVYHHVSECLLKLIVDTHDKFIYNDDDTTNSTNDR